MPASAITPDAMSSNPYPGFEPGLRRAVRFRAYGLPDELAASVVRLAGRGEEVDRNGDTLTNVLTNDDNTTP